MTSGKGKIKDNIIFHLGSVLPLEMLLIVSFACFKKFYPFFSFPNFFFHFELQRAVLVKTLDCFWRDHLINMNRLSSAVTYMRLLIWSY